MKRSRVAYLVTHPIQYQAPLLRRVAREPDIELKVFFGSDLSTREFVDKEFGRAIAWDVPLLNGYDYEFLPEVGKAGEVSSWRPWNYGLARRLGEGRFDLLWVHGYARPCHWVAMAAAKRLGMKVVVRDDVTKISRRRSATKRAVKRLLFKWLDAVVDGFLAIGTLNEEYYREQGVAQEKIFHVPYAVDNSFFQKAVAAAAPKREELRASLGLKATKPVILYAAKMTARKRPHDLLEAYAQLSPDGREEPPAYLLYVGDGPERPRLEGRAAALAWDGIRFLGFRNQGEIPRYYDLCDVFVLPSVDEPWGLVVNEVMNAGKPVVASDRVGCVRDLVWHQRNGFVFQAGDIRDLRDALHRVAADPGLRSVMGSHSLQIINRWGFEEDIAGLRAAVASLCGEGLSARRCESSLLAT